MAGVPLSNYLDFFAGTGVAIVDGPQDIVNDARKNAPALARWLNGKDMKDLIKGGRSISSFIMLDEQSTAENHLPGATFTWTGPQVLDQTTYKWTFTMDHAALVEQEWMLNGPQQMTGKYRFQQLIDIQAKAEMRVKTSLYNFMSSKFWTEPDFTTMEGTGVTATEQNSIAVFVNEYANGLFNSAGSAGTAFTTVGGINPTTAGNSRWAPRFVQYSSSATGQPKGSGSTAGATQNDVIAAFDDMFLRIKYPQYRMFDEYMKANAMNQVFIATSKRGMTHFKQCCRDRQDRFISAADPNWPGVNYAGIPIEYHEELDTATLYPNHQTLASATDNVTEGNSGSANANMGLGPRYYWLHPASVTPVFHEERYFYKRKPITPDDQPEAVIIPYSTWWNIICTSRRRLGIVGPTGNAFAAYSN